VTFNVFAKAFSLVYEVSGSRAVLVPDQNTSLPH